MTATSLTHPGAFHAQRGVQGPPSTRGPTARSRQRPSRRLT